MRLSRITAAVGAAMVIGVFTAAPAEAHTTLIKATPASGATVPSPARIELTFSDPVRFPGVVVLDAKGGHHELGKPQVSGNRVTEPVAGVLPPGVYRVGWRVVAPDGHPGTGEYTFTVAGRAGTTPTGSPAAPASPAATPRAERTSSGGWWWVGLGVLVVAAAGGGLALARRRR